MVSLKGLFTRKSKKVAPAPGPVLKDLPKEEVKRLNDAGIEDATALMLKYAVLRGVHQGQLAGLLERSKAITFASEGDRVVAIRFRTGKTKATVIPASKASLFSTGGSRLQKQTRRTQRNRRNRKGE